MPCCSTSASPKLDGLEVARRIRADPGSSALLLIAMTGSSEPRDRASTSLSAGFDHHLVKPVNPEELRELPRSSGGRGDPPGREPAGHEQTCPAPLVSEVAAPALCCSERH